MKNSPPDEPVSSPAPATLNTSEFIFMAPWEIDAIVKKWGNGDIDRALQNMAVALSVGQQAPEA